MLKEIFEQPLTLRDAIRGRLNPIDGTARLSGLNLQYEQLQHINRIIFLACGTSWHAGLIGEYMIEENAGIPVEVEYASSSAIVPHNPGRNYCLCHLPVRRNCRYIGGYAGSQEKRSHGFGNL